MTMSPDRWARLRAIFEELADLPRDEQALRLDQFTFGDADLRTELGALLIAAREVGDRFETPATLGSALEPELDPVQPGTRIGPYQIVREIGRGGMGAVYEAVRDDAEYAKRVALKMVPQARGSDAILRRFRYERQILARLEHKNIAALLDGGVTADGRPFFAMEFVEGERIDHYCEHRRLGIRERLQLFRQICGAVHYAHQNLVVHRDLKPGNILVRADGTAKLLDFGIAKLVDPTDESEGLTQGGMLPMTTGYASPEQLRGESITTASDIYSLGIVLYELLAGRPPFADPGLPVLEVRRRMLEVTPLPPSALATAASAMASGEGTVGRLKRTLAGELDNIVLMALRKEPDRRYRSAEQMGEDVLRFLAGLPVQAQPDSIGYRVGKFVRRNRVAMAATTVATAALVAGTVVSLWQAKAARQERDRAQVAEQTATKVTEFFQSILTSAKPAEQGKQVTVLEAIDRAVAGFDSAFAGNPPLRAAVAGSVGSALHDLGEYERALPLLQAAYQYHLDRDRGRPTKEGAESVYNYAGEMWNLGRLAEAESLFRRSLKMFEAIKEPVTEIAVGYGQLAIVLADRGDLEGAIAMSGEVIGKLSANPADRGKLATATLNHSTYLAQPGRYQEAAAMFRRAAVELSAVNGPENQAVAGALQPLAYSLMVLGQFDGADSAARRGLAIREKALGRSDPRTLQMVRTIGEIALENGHPDRALSWLREVVGARGRSLGDGDPELAAGYALLGRALAELGHGDVGMEAAQESRRLRVAALGPEHGLVFASDNVIGTILALRGRRKEAEPLLEASLAGLERTMGPDHFRTRQARQRLAAVRGIVTPPR